MFNNFIFWFKNLFKYKHGYAKNCLYKNNCPVCRTPWPIKSQTPTEKYLQSINYYNKYMKVYKNNFILNMPKGMSGEELIKIANILKPEYDILTKGKSEQEIIKRGASIAYDKNQINKS